MCLIEHLPIVQKEKQTNNRKDEPCALHFYQCGIHHQIRLFGLRQVKTDAVIWPRLFFIAGSFWLFFFSDYYAPWFDGDGGVGLERLAVEQRAAVAEGVGDGFRFVGIVEDVMDLLAIIVDTRTKDDGERVLTFGSENLLTVGSTCQ